MKARLVTTCVAVAGVAQLVTGVAPAHGATTCTWGGTPAAPTGHSTNTPGVSTAPSAVPLRFRAAGPLGGGPGCRGTMRFAGQMDKGATCALINFHARVYGLRGVRTVIGTSAGGFAPARLFDRAGNLVGTEDAQFLTNAPFSACYAKEGLRSINFSSVVVLYR